MCVCVSVNYECIAHVHVQVSPCVSGWCVSVYMKLGYQCVSMLCVHVSERMWRWVVSGCVYEVGVSVCECAGCAWQPRDSRKRWQGKRAGAGVRLWDGPEKIRE